jgi:hypothetical protein
MLFSLEALRARHGDCLILHFGESDDPRLMVIDGGPLGVYKNALRPRLDALAKAIGRDGRLTIDVLMVSHIDDDHIRGILELSSRMSEDKDHARPFEVRTLWLNAFDDMVGKDARKLAAGIAEAPARVEGADLVAGNWEGNAQAVVASVPEGRELRNNARGLGWKANQGFEAFVMAPNSGGRTVTFGELTLTVVWPVERQLEALRKEWERKLQALRAAASPAEVADIAKDIDDSVYNLSSIVCLAELGGKRMLLTGDALGANIVEGLRAAGLLDASGRIAVDILKLPHHGSDRSVDEEFFKTIQARHYVVSGDGRHHNPEPKTLGLISKTRSDNDFALHLTYRNCSDRVGEELAAFFLAESNDGRTYQVDFRDEAALSLCVDLLDPVNY